MVDLLCDDAMFVDNEILVTCKGMLDFISKTLVSKKLPELFDDGANQQVMKSIPPQIMQRATQVRFADVIGCDAAKQSLHENVVLPFVLCASVKADIYKGLKNRFVHFYPLSFDNRYPKRIRQCPSSRKQSIPT